MSWTPEDKVIWDDLSPTLKAKFRDIVKDAVKNYLKDKGLLSDALENAFFVNLPPKINTSDNTTLDITTVDGTKTPIVVKFDPNNIVSGPYYMKDEELRCSMWYTDKQNRLCKMWVNEDGSNIKSAEVMMPRYLSNMKSSGEITTNIEYLWLTSMTDGYAFVKLRYNNNIYYHMIITQRSSNPEDWQEYEDITEIMSFNNPEYDLYRIKPEHDRYVSIAYMPHYRTWIKAYGCVTLTDGTPSNSVMVVAYNKDKVRAHQYVPALYYNRRSYFKQTPHDYVLMNVDLVQIPDSMMRSATYILFAPLIRGEMVNGKLTPVSTDRRNADDFAIPIAGAYSLVTVDFESNLTPKFLTNTLIGHQHPILNNATNTLCGWKLTKTPGNIESIRLGYCEKRNMLYANTMIKSNNNTILETITYTMGPIFGITGWETILKNGVPIHYKEGEHIYTPLQEDKEKWFDEVYNKDIKLLNVFYSAGETFEATIDYSSTSNPNKIVDAAFAIKDAYKYVSGKMQKEFNYRYVRPSSGWTTIENLSRGVVSGYELAFLKDFSYSKEIGTRYTSVSLYDNTAIDVLARNRIPSKIIINATSAVSTSINSKTINFTTRCHDSTKIQLDILDFDTTSILYKTFLDNHLKYCMSGANMYKTDPPNPIDTTMVYILSYYEDKTVTESQYSNADCSLYLTLCDKNNVFIHHKIKGSKELYFTTSSGYNAPVPISNMYFISRNQFYIMMMRDHGDGTYDTGVYEISRVDDKSEFTIKKQRLLDSTMVVNELSLDYPNTTNIKTYIRDINNPFMCQIADIAFYGMCCLIPVSDGAYAICSIGDQLTSLNKPRTLKEYMNNKYDVSIFNIRQKTKDEQAVIKPAKCVIGKAEVFLGGKYSYMDKNGPFDLTNNATTYFYLHRKNRAKGITLKKYDAPLPESEVSNPIKAGKPYSDPYMFESVLVATVKVEGNQVINVTKYPIGDNYLYLNYK